MQMARRAEAKLYRKMENSDEYETIPVFFHARVEKSDKAIIDSNGSYLGQSTCAIITYDLGIVPNQHDKIEMNGKKWFVVSSSLAVELFHRADSGSLPGAAFDCYCPKRINLS